MTRRGKRLRPGTAVRRPYRGPGAVDSIGVDVGGVIVDRIAQGTDTSFFGDRPLETPAVFGAFDGLRVLNELFQGRVYIISKAGPKIAGKSQQWLHHHRVFAQTGVTPDHLFFVRDRKDKAGVCRKLNITHFVDDRLEVLVHLETVDHRYLFIGGLGDHAPARNVPAAISVVSSWQHLLARVQSDGVRQAPS